MTAATLRANPTLDNAHAFGRGRVSLLAPAADRSLFIACQLIAEGRAADALLVGSLTATDRALLSALV